MFEQIIKDWRAAETIDAAGFRPVLEDFGSSEKIVG
jgi:hypothetical protein